MPAILVQTFIAAPVQSVWDALDAKADLLFDALPADAWPDGDAQPPFQRSAAWPFTAPLGGPTQVELVLHDLGEGTRLDVRHTGWGDGAPWEAAIQGHFAGWLQGLAALGLVLETGVDARVRDAGLSAQERYFISGELPATSAPVYRALTDPLVRARWAGAALELLAGAVLAESVDNRFARWRLTSGGEVTAILRVTPRGTHVALAEHGVSGKGASQRWPAMFDALARFLV